MSSRVEQVSTPDGQFDLTVWLPEAGRGPGLLLVQEIFGVGEYIHAVAEDLAALGYVVAAPEVGHAFHNRKAPMFHYPEAAARAWHRTEEFLARHLPARDGAQQP